MALFGNPGNLGGAPAAVGLWGAAPAVPAPAAAQPGLFQQAPDFFEREAYKYEYVVVVCAVCIRVASLKKSGTRARRCFEG